MGGRSYLYRRYGLGHFNCTPSYRDFAQSIAIGQLFIVQASVNSEPFG